MNKSLGLKGRGYFLVTFKVKFLGPSSLAREQRRDWIEGESEHGREALRRRGRDPTLEDLAGFPKAGGQIARSFGRLSAEES